MNAYFWIPLLSGLGCLAYAVLVLAREPWATGNRVLAAILASGAGWGVAEALWTLAPDAGSALAVLRGSVPAWAFLGPLALHLMAARERSVTPRLPALLPYAYGVAALFVLVGLRESTVVEFTGMGRVLFSLCHALVLLLPLVALTLTGQVVNRARDEGALELYLTHPVRRANYFAAVSLVKPVLPHWGLIGAVGLMPMLGASWADRLARRPGPTRRRLAAMAAATATLTALVVVQARTGLLQAGGPGPFALLPSEADPTRDLVGWDQIADECGYADQAHLIRDFHQFTGLSPAAFLASLRTRAAVARPA